MKIIPYGRQWVDEKDIRAVVNVLKSDYLTQGPKIEEFEKAVADYCGVKYAVAVNSGTSALHIACLTASIKQGDEVVTSPITFVASANCVVYCSGKPVFADIDPETYNIAPGEIEKRITDRTKALIPVHFAGQSCEMEEISRLVRIAEKKYGHRIFIIEDASHALGSKYKGAEVGACGYSDMAAFSFHPVKHVTTGEGGAVLTNNSEFYEKLLNLRSHGITKIPEKFTNEYLAFDNTSLSEPKLPNPWYYEMQVLGYNYRITDIQCALGISQLKRLNENIERRRVIVSRYNEAFKNLDGVEIPVETEIERSSYHLYVLQIDFEKIGKSRAGIMYELKRKGIGTQVHYIPVHTQPFYREKFGTNWGDCPKAEKYYQNCLSIPLYPTMSENDVERVIENVTRVVENNSNC